MTAEATPAKLTADMDAAADYAAHLLGEVPCDICDATGKVGVESYAHGAPYTIGETECSACCGTGKGYRLLARKANMEWTDDQWRDNLARAFIDQERAHIALVEERDALRVALDVHEQAIREIRHAQDAGPGWYTRGESGMYQQVRMWIRKAEDASKALAAPPAADAKETGR